MSFLSDWLGVPIKSVSPETEELPERIRKLNVARIAASVICRESERLCNTFVSTTADLRDRRALQEEADLSRQRLKEIERQLESAQTELNRQTRVRERPGLVARLARIKAILDTRNKDAVAAQRALEAFSNALHRLDKSTAELYGETRDETARGMHAFNSDFHPMNLAVRLRVPLALSLRTTSYRNLCKQPLLTPNDDRIDFSEIEIRVGQKLIQQLERELSEIDALARQEIAS